MSGFSINNVTVSGNLTRDPDVRYTQSGTAVCNLRIANNKRVKDDNAPGGWKDAPRFFDVTVWSGMGEWCGKNLGKGSGVVVSGELDWNEWKDKEGNNRQSVYITAYSVVPQRPGESNGGGGGGFSQRSDVPVDTADFAPRADPAPAARTADNLPVDDDIPF